jgi:SAM-dependent methyltransferase
MESAMPLPDSSYVFGDEHIEFPLGGVPLATCASCGLLFKTVLPAPGSLAQVFERQAGKKWMEPYDFRDETVEVQHLSDGEHIDVLDVGSGSGAFLGALSRGASSGRRSALDVVQHPGCAEQISGEFIRGLLDNPSLQWSGQPYDIVTLFDVLEHLYEPQLAFKNLRELVRDNGLVLIETGNVESDWPQRYGAHHWWYVRLFEHHVFWSRRSLEQLAAQFGFRLLIWRELRHKARTSVPLPQVLNQMAQMGLYRVAPRAYPNIAPLLGKYWTQPWSPFVRDHFRVVLRKL